MKKSLSILEAISIGMGALGVGAIAGIITGSVLTSKKKGYGGGKYKYHIDTTITPVPSIESKPLKKLQSGKKNCSCNCHDDE